MMSFLCAYLLRGQKKIKKKSKKFEKRVAYYPVICYNIFIK
nr:MAG TPA: hypothetical protein [Caudoviricetes sp.]